MNIDKYVLNKIRNFYKYRNINFWPGKLDISYSQKGYISAEEIEFINLMSPKILKIDSIIWTVENIKALALLNCTNVDVKFNYEKMLNFSFWLINTPIQLFDSTFNQMLTFEWKSIDLSFENNKITEIKLITTCTDNFLFIPLETIGSIISNSGFREILSTKEISKQFADLGFNYQFNTDWFIVPMKYINKIFIELDDYGLTFLNQFIDINQVFKEKYIELTLFNFMQLTRIK